MYNARPRTMPSIFFNHLVLYINGKIIDMFPYDSFAYPVQSYGRYSVLHEQDAKTLSNLYCLKVQIAV